VEQTGKRQFKIVLTQGLNRQIRRMCEYFGYRVEKLVRTRIMNIALGDLESGKYRDVTPEEYRILLARIKDSSNETVMPVQPEKPDERLAGEKTRIPREQRKQNRQGGNRTPHKRGGGCV
jgi:23S rRNA pseudouridine2604 synthase